jgi:hypothetical protein
MALAVLVSICYKCGHREAGYVKICSQCERFMDFIFENIPLDPDLKTYDIDINTKRPAK